MKVKNALYLTALAIFGTSFATLALAKTINLYEQPQDNAKVVGNIDLSAGIVPIFSTPKGDWMKVGDPKNGNVGWVKSSETEDPEGATSFSYIQKTIDNGKGPKTYQVIQYGSPHGKNLTAEQQKLYKELQIQRMKMQKAWEDMMNSVKYPVWRFPDWTAYPFVVPVLVPVQEAPVQPQTPAKQPEIKK